MHFRPTGGLILAAVLLLTYLAYAGVPHQDFVSWDDDVLVYQNPHYRQVTPEKLAFFWKSSYEGLYIPLTYTAWGLLASLAHRQLPHKIVGGPETHLDPATFHSADVALHLINVTLVFLILCRLLAVFQRRPTETASGQEKTAELGTVFLPAAAGALLFGVHPLQVEAVAWISEMKGVLCTTFCLAALLFWVSGNDASAPQKTAWQFLRLGGVLLCFVLALLAKPSAVMLPLLAWAVGSVVLRLPDEPVPAARRGTLVLLLAISVAWVQVARGAQPTSGAVTPSPLWQRPFIWGDADTFYLAKLLVPVSLGPDYGRTPEALFHYWWAYCTWIPTVVLLALAWRLRRGEHRMLTAAILMMFIATLPVSGLVPFLYQQYSTVADRYFYLAMLGPAMALAWGMSWLNAAANEDAKVHKRAVLGQGAATIALFLCGFGTLLQTLYWKDNYTLFDRALDVNPASWMACINKGAALLVDDHPDDARQLMEKAISFHRPPPSVYLDLGAAYNKMHQPETGLRMYRHVQNDAEVSASAHFGAAECLEALGRWKEAADDYKQAMRLDPTDPRTPYNLGNVLAHHGQFAEAAGYFKQAIALDPDYAEAYQNLALDLLAMGQKDAAIAMMRQALLVRPGFKPAVLALQQLTGG